MVDQALTNHSSSNGSLTELSVPAPGLKGSEIASVMNKAMYLYKAALFNEEPIPPAPSDQIRSPISVSYAPTVLCATLRMDLKPVGDSISYRLKSETLTIKVLSDKLVIKYEYQSPAVIESEKNQERILQWHVVPMEKCDLKGTFSEAGGYFTKNQKFKLFQNRYAENGNPAVWDTKSDSAAELQEILRTFHHRMFGVDSRVVRRSKEKNGETSED